MHDLLDALSEVWVAVQDGWDREKGLVTSEGKREEAWTRAIAAIGVVGTESAEIAGVLSAFT